MSATKVTAATTAATSTAGTNASRRRIGKPGSTRASSSHARTITSASPPLSLASAARPAATPARAAASHAAGPPRPARSPAPGPEQERQASEQERLDEHVGHRAPRVHAVERVDHEQECGEQAGLAVARQDAQRIDGDAAERTADHERPARQDECAGRIEPGRRVGEPATRIRRAGPRIAAAPGATVRSGTWAGARSRTRDTRARRGRRGGPRPGGRQSTTGSTLPIRPRSAARWPGRPRTRRPRRRPPPSPHNQDDRADDDRNEGVAGAGIVPVSGMGGPVPRDPA